MLTDTFVMRDIIFLSGSLTLISTLFFATAFGLGAGAAGIMVGAILGGVIGLGVFVVTVLSVLFVLDNRWPLEIRIDDVGVRLRSTADDARRIYRTPLLHALFGGREMREDASITDQSAAIGTTWTDVRAVRFNEQAQIVGIKSGAFRAIRIYCTRANYPDVVRRVDALVRGHAPTATFR